MLYSCILRQHRDNPSSFLRSSVTSSGVGEGKRWRAKVRDGEQQKIKRKKKKKSKRECARETERKKEKMTGLIQETHA